MSLFLFSPLFLKNLILTPILMKLSTLSYIKSPTLIFYSPPACVHSCSLFKLVVLLCINWKLLFVA